MPGVWGVCVRVCSVVTTLWDPVDREWDFPGRNTWSGLPFPPLGAVPLPTSLRSHALAGRCCTTSAPWGLRKLFSSSSDRCFPGSVVKNPPANAGDTGDVSWIPGSGRLYGGGNGNPLQYSCLENPMDRGAWRATVTRSRRVAHDWAQPVTSAYDTEYPEVQRCKVTHVPINSSHPLFCCVAGCVFTLSRLILTQAQKVLASPSYRQGNKPIELKDLDQRHSTHNWQMQPLFQLQPSASRTRRSPCPETCLVASAWPPGWVRVVPPGARSPFAPIAPTRVLPSAGQPPRAPWLAGGHPCPVLVASPCSQLLGMGSSQVVRRIRREAGRCELMVSSFLWPGISVSSPWCFLLLSTLPPPPLQVFL